MKALVGNVVLMVFLAAHCVGLGIVCPPNFCENVTCSEVTAESCDGGHVKANATFCGCCPSCVTYIPNNGSCVNLVLVVPITTECEPGTACIDGRCSPLSQLVTETP